MLSLILFLIAGFVLLGAGAEILVRGSSRLALQLGISPLIVGLTIVAFGTSAPELAVSIQSASADLGGLALGNVIGSNIANIGLILGVTALINPVTIERDLLKKQIPLVIVASFLLWGLLADKELTTVDGIILTTGMLAFILYSYYQVRVETQGAELSLADRDSPNILRKILVDIFMIIVGMMLLVYGSQLFVDNAVSMARIIGISEAVIGLSLVAIGTSIPELATCVSAALKKQSNIAIGNVVGSNLFNILGILGITALISNVDGSQLATLDFVVMILFALALYPLAKTSMKISRVEGLFLLAAYITYIAVVVQK